MLGSDELLMLYVICKLITNKAVSCEWAWPIQCCCSPPSSYKKRTKTVCLFDLQCEVLGFELEPRAR